MSVNEGKGNHLKEDANIREPLGRHYSNVTYEIMKEEVTKEMKKFMKYNNSNSRIVMGAYGRSALSRL